MSEAFRKVRDLYYRGASGMGVATARFWSRTAAPLSSLHKMKTNSLGAWMMVRIFGGLDAFVCGKYYRAASHSCQRQGLFVNMAGLLRPAVGRGRIRERKRRPSRPAFRGTQESSPDLSR